MISSPFYVYFKKKYIYLKIKYPNTENVVLKLAKVFFFPAQQIGTSS